MAMCEKRLEQSPFSNLDPNRFSLNFPTFLPDGVMAAPEILDLLVQVRILVGQPFDAPQNAACSWPAASINETHECVDRRNAANGPEPVEGHGGCLFLEPSIGIYLHWRLTRFTSTS